MKTVKNLCLWFWAEFIYPVWEFFAPSRDDDEYSGD